MEHEILILGPRKGGRPRATEPKSILSTRIPAKCHDILIKLADERSTSVSAVVSDLVQTACKVIERRRPS